MFSILGTTGTLFKGPMEDLVRVQGVLPSSAARRTDAFLEHLNDAERRQHYTHWPQQPPSHTPAPPPPKNRQPAQAAGAYARVQSPATPARHALRTVGDVMSARVIVVGNDQTIQQGWQVLSDAGVGQAPVVSLTGGLVGLFSRAELLRLDQLPSPDQGVLAWRTWLGKPLASIMTTPVPAVYPDTDLRRLAQVLLLADMPGLPVLDAQEKLVGFVSRKDVLKAVVHEPPLDLWS